VFYLSTVSSKIDWRKKTKKATGQSRMGWIMAVKTQIVVVLVSGVPDSMFWNLDGTGFCSISDEISSRSQNRIVCCAVFLIFSVLNFCHNVTNINLHVCHYINKYTCSVYSNYSTK